MSLSYHYNLPYKYILVNVNWAVGMVVGVAVGVVVGVAKVVVVGVAGKWVWWLWKESGLLNMICNDIYS